MQSEVDGTEMIANTFDTLVDGVLQRSDLTGVVEQKNRVNGCAPLRILFRV